MKYKVIFYIGHQDDIVEEFIFDNIFNFDITVNGDLILSYKKDNKIIENYCAFAVGEWRRIVPIMEG